MPTMIGTSYFPSRNAAIRYYRPYHFDDTASAVDRKILDGEITIGIPSCKTHERVILIDDGLRFAIVTPDLD